MENLSIPWPRRATFEELQELDRIGFVCDWCRGSEEGLPQDATIDQVFSHFKERRKEYAPVVVVENGVRRVFCSEKCRNEYEASKSLIDWVDAQEDEAEPQKPKVSASAIRRKTYHPE